MEEDIIQKNASRNSPGGYIIEERVKRRPIYESKKGDYTGSRIGH